MAWPLSQDYNEAIQDPASGFADPELKAGQPVLNAMGIPMPRSGNFADVYEFDGASGSKWAIKCFTREVPGLRERYSEISRQLLQAKLPFTVDFKYLEQGIRIRGQWYPVLKMQWVEGFLLNEFVRNHLDKPAILDGLGQIWLRMGKRLREAGIAHADLQHGNVILVPGSRASALAVKLIDYDGMVVPALARKKSGEVGHPAYQHPQRLQQGIYSAEVDRLPLLAIACALRGLAVGGKALWGRYDNGDNMLFREVDLRKPGESAVFKELWTIPDAAVHDLVGYLALGVMGPLAEVPLLHEMVSGNQPRPLSAAEERQVTALLGVGVQVNRPAPVQVAVAPAVAVGARSERPSPTAVRPDAIQPAAAMKEVEVWDGLAEDEPVVLAPRRKAAGKSKVWFAVVGGGLAAVLVMALVAFSLTGNKKPTPKNPGRQLSQNPPSNKKQPKPPDNKPPDNQKPADKKQPDAKQPEEKQPEEKRPVGEKQPRKGRSPLVKLDPAQIAEEDLHAGFGQDLVAVLKGYPGQIWHVAFAPHGRFVVANGYGQNTKTIYLWDLTLLTSPPSKKTFNDPASVAFSPDGTRMAVATGDHLDIWKEPFLDGEPVHTFQIPRAGSGAEQANGVSYTSDGNAIRVSTNSQVLGLDLTNPDAKLSHLGNQHGYLVFSPNGIDLAVAEDSGLVRLLNPKKPPTKELANKGVCWAMAFSPDGHRLVTSNLKGSVYLWDVTGQKVDKPLWEAKEHNDFVNGVAFAPNGKTFVSTEGGNSRAGARYAIWWNNDDRQKKNRLKKWLLPERCATVAFAPDSPYVALGCHNSKIYILRLGRRTKGESSLPETQKWNHLELAGAELKDGFVRIRPNGSVRTNQKYTGPIEVTLEVQSSTPTVALQFFRQRQMLVLPETNTWCKFRVKISEKSVEVFGANSRMEYRDPKPQLQPAADVRVLGWKKDQMVDVKSLAVRSLKD